MSDNVPSCNPVQYQRKLLTQILENGEKRNFGPQIFFGVLPLLVVSSSKLSSMQFKGKLMNQTWENGENLIPDLILARLTQIWAPKFFFVCFTSTRCQALLQAIIIFDFNENMWSKLKKMAKNLILGLT